MRQTLASRNAQEALHLAIFVKEQNAGTYHRFAEMFTEFRDLGSLEIASVFGDIVVEETRQQRGATGEVSGALWQGQLRAHGRRSAGYDRSSAAG